MFRGIRVLCTATLVLAGALPVAADVTTMTCADFMAMDAPGKKTTAGEMLAWLDTSANSPSMPNLVAKYTSHSGGEAWLPEDFVVEIEGHCADADPAMGVFARLDTHS